MPALQAPEASKSAIRRGVERLGPPLVVVLAILIAVRALVDRLPAFFSIATQSVSLTALIAVTILVFGTVQVIRYRRGILGFVIASLVLTIFAVIGSAEFGLLPWVEGLRIMSVLGAAAIMLNTREQITVRGVALTVQLIAFLPAVLAIFQAATGTGMLVQGDLRSVGTLAHPNTAGLLFALTVICGVYRVLGSRNWYDIVFTFVAAAALVTTLSLGSMAAVAVAFTVLLLLTPALRRRTKLIVAGAFVTLGFGLLVSPMVSSRLAGFTDGSADGSAVLSLVWRINEWADLVQQFTEHPVLGRGLGASTGETIVKDNLPHNEYLRVLVELGLVGSAAACGCLIALIIFFSRAFRRAHHRDAAALALSVTAGLVVNAFVANTLLYSVAIYVAVIILTGAYRELRPRPPLLRPHRQPAG